MKNVGRFFLILLMSCTFFTQEATAQIVSNACASWNQVATACVGECGNTSTITYPVLCSSNHISNYINFCVRNEASNLCPNTGAIVRVFVNGQLAAYGNITSVGSSVSFAAKCGNTVKVVTTTYPLNNGINCVRQGELTVGLRRHN